MRTRHHGQGWAPHGAQLLRPPLGRFPPPQRSVNCGRPHSGRVPQATAAHLWALALLSASAAELSNSTGSARPANPEIPLHSLSVALYRRSLPAPPNLEGTEFHGFCKELLLKSHPTAHTVDNKGGKETQEKRQCCVRSVPGSMTVFKTESLTSTEPSSPRRPKKLSALAGEGVLLPKVHKRLQNQPRGPVTAPPALADQPCQVIRPLWPRSFHS